MMKKTVVGMIRHDELLCILTALSKARPDLITSFELVAEAVGVASELRAELPPLIVVEKKTPALLIEGT